VEIVIDLVADWIRLASDGKTERVRGEARRHERRGGSESEFASGESTHLRASFSASIS
jgi:hypothetical protein